MKPTYFEIPIALFNNHPVMIFVNYDGAKLRAAYQRWKVAEPQKRAVEHLAKWWDNEIVDKDLSGCTQITPEGPVVLLLLPDSDPAVANAVAHEMVHAAWRVMEGVAIEPNKHTEEILAYLVGYLTSKAMAGIDRHAKPKKKK